MWTCNQETITDNPNGLCALSKLLNQCYSKSLALSDQSNGRPLSYPCFINLNININLFPLLTTNFFKNQTLEGPGSQKFYQHYQVCPKDGAC